MDVSTNKADQNYEDEGGMNMKGDQNENEIRMKMIGDQNEDERRSE